MRIISQCEKFDIPYEIFTIEVQGNLVVGYNGKYYITLGQYKNQSDAMKTFLDISTRFSYGHDVYYMSEGKGQQGDDRVLITSKR